MTSDARSESLLVRPTFSIRTPGGSTSTLSLTELLATLGSSEVEAFLGLQAHQTHAWHAFLVQLAAIAIIMAKLRGFNPSWFAVSKAMGRMTIAAA